MQVRRVAETATPAAVAEAMAAAAREALTDLRTAILARQILALYPTLATLDAFGAWAESVRHVREPLDFGELIVAPWRTLTTRVGDCDDVAAAVAALCAITGHPTAVAIVAAPTGAHAVCLAGDDPYGPPGRLTHTIDQFTGCTRVPPSRPRYLAFQAVK